MNVPTSPRASRGQRFLALVTGASLALAAGVAAGPAANAASDVAHAVDTPLTVADLAMTGDGQQRWQSLPKSRLVLNPFDRYARGSNGSLTRYDSEVYQNSGPNLPVRAAYYANDLALRFPDLLTVHRQGPVGEAPPATSTALPGPYTAANGWADDRVTSAASGGQTTVTVNAGSTFGKISKNVTVNLSETPNLTIDIAALSTDAKWALEIGSKKPLPADATVAGQFTFNLAALTELSGSQTLDVKLWVAGGTGKSATLNSLTLHGDTVANPAQDKRILWRDEMSSADGWYTGSQGATVSSNGAQGLVKIEGAGVDYGSGGKDLSIDVTATTRLAVKVDAFTHQWALQVREGDTSKSVQSNTTATGWRTYDFASIVGTGTKNLKWRLFTTGARPSGALFDEIVIYDDAVSEPWTQPHNLQPASSFDTTWTASQETFTGTYGANGTITGRDVFTAVEAIVREIDTTDLTGNAVVGGLLQGTPSWDATTGQLTVTSAESVQVYQLPAGVTVGFGPTVAQATSPAALASHRAWSAVLPNGVHKVAVAFAPVSTSSTYGTGLTQAAGIAAASAAATAGHGANLPARVAELDTFWNGYLAGVPRPHDFTLHDVNAYGASEAQIKAAYYRAWINLEQNVIPATPETNSLSAQLGTGKASMWMSGIPGAKNVATWDTLVGLQALAYSNPQTAWESYTGIMDFVQPEESAFPGEITNDPTKGGEVLPSRKAQTAWVLYNATGDKAKLEAIYPALTRVLKFAKTNLHWTVKDRGTYNYTQRDSEFVTSLILDLNYAKKISALLGHDADVAQWTTDQADLYDKFDTWFLQNGTFVQKVILSYDDDLFASDPKPGGYSPATVSSVNSNGDTSVVATSLALPGISNAARDALLGRFGQSGTPGLHWTGGDSHFSGLGDNLKGPNINYLTTALLDGGHVTDGKAKAAQFNESVIRDITRSGWFAEVYQRDGNFTSDKPLVDGVRPSLFGIAAFIDAVWIANGFRIAEGDASFVKLSAGRTGGITGLTTLGRGLNVQLNDAGAVLSGPAVGPGATVQIPLAVGATGTIPAANLPPSSPAATATTLSLSKTSQPVGATGDERTVATVSVSSAATGFDQAPGTVTLRDASNGNAVIASGAFSGADVTLTVPGDLTQGTHHLVATFTPTAALWWAASQSAARPLIVVARPVNPPTDPGPAAAALSLSLNAGKVTAGARPVATVAVSTSGTWTSGKVTITQGTRVLATLTIPASKRASVQLPRMTSVGSLRLQAKFAGNKQVSPAASPVITLRVAKAKAKVKVVAKKTVGRGKKLTVSVRVTAPAGLTKSGRATVRIGKGKARTVKVNAKGRATVKLKATKRGKQQIRVTYRGSVNVTAAKASKALRVVR